MRLTLSRALLASVLLHVALSHVLLSWVLHPTLDGESGPPLMLRLVEPREARAADPDPPARETPPDTRADGNVPAHAALAAGGGGGSATGAETPSSAAGGNALEGSAGGPSEDVDVTAPEGVAAEEDGATAVRARPAMQVAELHRRLELDTAGLSEAGLGRLQPLLVRWADHPERRSASSYRELLRTYIDVLMGRPYPVVDWLRRQPIRYLAELEVAVDGDGRFRFTEIYFYPNLPDGGGRVRDYYRRVLLEVADRPFLPPADAGLPAPHRLTYRLLNPETR